MFAMALNNERDFFSDTAESIVAIELLAEPDS
jgi:hypothetical protein